MQLNNYRHLPFPYNILLTEQELRRVLHSRDRYREITVIKQDDASVCLSVREHFRRAYGLYYIPVIPIYRLWQKPELISTAELLTAVCAYLYVEAGLSYYRDEATYMYYNYEIMQEWLLDVADEEGEDKERELGCLTEALEAGEFIQAKMMDKTFRESFGESVAAYHPETAFQQNALTVAQKAWELSQAYPGHNLFEYASQIEETSEDYYYDNAVYMHEYIGFIGSSTDAVSDTLFDMVENDFNERGRSQEPELLTWFDQPVPAYRDKLTYAAQALDLITDLCTLLYKQP